MDHDCHTPLCREHAAYRITGGGPGPGRGIRLLGWACKEHVQEVAAYFQRIGHQTVQYQLIRGYYRIRPLRTPADAATFGLSVPITNGVYVDANGSAWLGQVYEKTVIPHVTAQSTYIPAPDGWEARVNESLAQN